ncbi:MAG: UvrB/UvrC motif-containing protein [Gemmatimonadota bacterium]|nr:UvrB/UvrC motif-containing protein [Gemmatimonadota bacterium]
MQCDQCGERPAEIQLTTIEDAEMKTLHLCAVCAGERGVAASAPVKAPLVDFLAQLGKPTAADRTSAPSAPCPFCGITAADFRRTGRLGCPQCWDHFESPLRQLLRRIHGSSQHVGKLYVHEESEAGDRLARLAAMRRRLQRAVETEDFETAAQLRDRIHALEGAE